MNHINGTVSATQEQLLRMPLMTLTLRNFLFNKSILIKYSFQRISGLTSEQAKEYLLKTVEEEVKIETAKLVKELESQAKEEADKKAKEIVVNAIQKCATDHVSETTISVVSLPNDEMKGRIIGREGRNIRTLESLTGSLFICSFHS